MPNHDGFTGGGDCAARRSIGGAVQWGQIPEHDTVLDDALVPPPQLQRDARAPSKAQALRLRGGEQLTLDADGETVLGGAGR